VLVVLAGVSIAALIPGTTGATTSISITAGACAGGGTSYCFTPESATGMTGTPVTWTNESGVGHTVTSCDATNCPGAPANTGSNTFNLSVAATSGSTASFTFSSAGTYTYYCMIHGYMAMRGSIQIRGPATPPPATSSATSVPRSTPRPTPRPPAAGAATATAAATPNGLTALPSPGGLNSAAPAPGPLATAPAAGGFPLAALIIVLAVVLAGGATGVALWRRSRS
jgi:plastocyanin